jgi:hypothetical protein
MRVGANTLLRLMGADLHGFVCGLGSFAAICSGYGSSFVRDHADGALSSAAVPRCGLGPLPPPLCRCAERTAGLILQAWWMFSQCARPCQLRGAQ